jgi:hypothetical protein
MIVALLTTVTISAVASIVTVAPARKPAPMIVTRVGRAVEPVDGEIAVTLGVMGAPGGGGVGSDGDLPSQAAHPIANANSTALRWILFVMASCLLVRKRESAGKT